MNLKSDLLLETAPFLEDLEHYCRIRSGSSNVYGVNEAQKHLVRHLTRMGFQSELLPNPDHRRSGDLLVARRFVNTQAPTIIFVSHADTLDGAELDQNRYSLVLTDKKIVGQGVLDDKASQFVALRGIAEFLRQENSLLNLIYVSSPNEELGSFGFHAQFEKLSLEADLVLGFEPALDAKDLVIERRGNRWYDVSVMGREAHAGRAHKEGLNAAHEIAFIIAKLHKLTNYKKDVTLNIGEIQTGSKMYNVVCGSATAKLDTRFSDIKSRDDLHKKILKTLNRRHIRAFSDGHTCEILWNIVDDCPPLHSNKESRRWAKIFAEGLGKIEGRPIELRGSGGGADVCYFNRKDLIVFDGLGACGELMHRSDEYVFLDSLWSRSQGLAHFLRQFQSEF